jgi:hypothetical protein
MNIYERVKRFDRLTGKPCFEVQWKEVRDDFTGKIIVDYGMYCSYGLEYGSSDPCFGSGGDEYNFGVKYHVNVYQFLGEDYHFDNDTDSEVKMMKEFIKNNRRGDGTIETFADMCRTARIRTATKLIEEKVISPKVISPRDLSTEDIDDDVDGESFIGGDSNDTSENQ